MRLGVWCRRALALAVWLCTFTAFAATSVSVIEYYNASLDHYFITDSAPEIAALDSGKTKGWKRTGYTFSALDGPVSGANPVCRIYLPPGLGDSHFYSVSASECAVVPQTFPSAISEASDVMYLGVPNPSTGECAAGWNPVYRLWNNRVDSNHRYTIDKNVRNMMVAKGYVSEGYGPLGVGMCAAPAAVTAASATVNLSASATSLVVPGSVVLSATVTPASGTSIVSVAFYSGSTLLGVKSLTPYTWAYNATTAASLTFSAVATDSKGNKGYSNAVAVNATSAPVAPAPTVSIVLTQTAPDTYSFNSSVSTAPGVTVSSYAWDFGDGTKAATATAVHKYLASGTYTVQLKVVDGNGKTGNAATTVVPQIGGSTPTPPSTPPSTPPPTSASDTVVPSIESTNWLQASAALHSNWVNSGGDWFDKNGVFNGPTPTISALVGTSTLTLDISAINGDLLLQGLQGWDAATIDGVPVVGFWTDPTSNRAQPLPAKYGRPSIILNPTRGKWLVLASSYAGQTVRIDKVAGPAIPSLPMVNTGATAPNVKKLDPTSEAAVNAAAGGSGNVAQPWAYDTSTGSINGLGYLRFAITPANQRGISWFIYHTPLQEVYGRYCIYIEEDVALGMTELGVKLPGLSGTEVSWRMEHGAIAPNNPNVYAALDYRYAADTGSGYGQINSFNSMFRAGRWYVIEQYAKNNTFNNGVANSDGQGKVWINGNLVWQSSTVKWNANPASVFNFLHVNVYHGGLGFPSQNIHYRIAGIAVSTSYIGPPPELANYVPPATGSGSASAPPPTSTPPPPSSPPPTSNPPVVAPPTTSPNPTSYPAWRRPLYIGQFSAIPNTANMNGTTTSTATINAWNGLAASDNTWYSALNGGHSDSSENKVMKIDLSVDAPAWTLLSAGSKPGAPDALYYPDGSPAARHTYYSLQFIKARNRVMSFGAVAVYGTGNGGGPVVDGFDLGTSKWDAQATWPNIPFLHIAASVAHDPATDDVYYAANGKFAKWQGTTGLWTTLNVPGSTGAWEFKGSVIDTIRRLWVQWNGGSLVTIDLATGIVGKIAVSGALPATVLDYSSIVHDLDNDRYLTVQGTGLYAIDPTTGASTLIATVPLAVNGVNNRLAYFKDLGGVAYLPEFKSNVLFMPTR